MFIGSWLEHGRGADGRLLLIVWVVRMLAHNFIHYVLCVLALLVRAFVFHWSGSRCRGSCFFLSAASRGSHRWGCSCAALHASAHTQLCFWVVIVKYQLSAIPSRALRRLAFYLFFSLVSGWC